MAMSKNRLSYYIFCTFLFSFIIFNFLSSDFTPNTDALLDSKGIKSSLFRESHQSKKTIFFFTEFLRNFANWEKIFRRVISGQCPVSRCILVSKRALLHTADAVVFSAMDLPQKDHLIEEMKELRRTYWNQTWIFFSMSPPNDVSNIVNLTNFNNMFNWTMTYKTNSDVLSPFGIKLDMNKDHYLLDEMVEDPFLVTEKEDLRREHLGTGVFKTCETHSGRELVLEDLESLMNVNIKSECNHWDNKRRKSFLMTLLFPGKPDRIEEIVQDNYFYFAFESAICSEYYTEHLFRALRLGAIPVVLADNGLTKLVPPNSFIDASKFRTSQRLADFLIRVAKDVDLLHSYHKWRENYQVYSAFPYDPWGCELCEKLHKNDIPDPKTYDALDEWFSDSECTRSSLAH